MNSSKCRLLRAALVVVLSLLALPALAQAVYARVDQPGHDLYESPRLFAKSVVEVPGGEKVEYLERDASWLWWKVRWSGKEGWISRGFVTALEAAADTPSAPLTVSTAAAPPPVKVAQSPPAPSRGQAVVFGISNYLEGRNIAQLPGVPVDMNSAFAMAALMGISADRVSVYRDAQVTKDGMISVLTQLAKNVQEGDPVLVYFSGHGGRRADDNNPGSCIEGLITHEAQLLDSAEMQRLLQPLAKLTDGLFVFFDACHSGGLTRTRALKGGVKPLFTAKSAELGDVSNCAEAVNMLRKPASGTRATGNKYIYAGAARANEVSLDSPTTGGMATSNFLACMAADNGKTRTVDELRACAQARIDRTMQGIEGFTKQNMTITGDLNMRPVRAELGAAARQQLLASAAQGTLAGGVASAKSVSISNAVLSQGLPQVANVQQAFAAIAARTNVASVLKVDAPDTIKIDVESLRVTVETPADGYLYVFHASADGSAVMLFPNTLDRDHSIRAGQPKELPRSDWRLIATGPAGDDQLLVVFSTVARDTKQLLGQIAGPFLDLDVSPTGMQALTLAMARTAFAGDALCKPELPNRPNYCTAGFSAHLKTIREVR